VVFEKILGEQAFGYPLRSAKNPSLFAQVLEEARVALRILRRLRPKAEDNFDILTPEASRGFLERLTGMIAVAIVPVSSGRPCSWRGSWS